MEDIFVSEADLPTTIKGYVVPDEDGNYSVYLNSKHSFETKVKTLYHETKHIEAGACYADTPVMNIEMVAEDEGYYG